MMQPVMQLAGASRAPVSGYFCSRAVEPSGDQFLPRLAANSEEKTSPVSNFSVPSFFAPRRDVFVLPLPVLRSSGAHFGAHGC